MTKGLFCSTFHITNYSRTKTPDVISFLSNLSLLQKLEMFAGSLGHLILISGRSGKEIKRILTTRTFFMPQLFTRDNELYVLYGTGGPVSPGNLSIVPLQNLISGNLVSSYCFMKNRDATNL